MSDLPLISTHQIKRQYWKESSFNSSKEQSSDCEPRVILDKSGTTTKEVPFHCDGGNHTTEFGILDRDRSWYLNKDEIDGENARHYIELGTYKTDIGGHSMNIDIPFYSSIFGVAKALTRNAIK